MRYLMVCENENCKFEGEQPYSACIADEAILDENNVAAVFCPHCNNPLVHRYEAGGKKPVLCDAE